jgi:hypothetical protein
MDFRGADIAVGVWAEEFVRPSGRLSPGTRQTARRDLDRYLCPLR